MDPMTILPKMVLKMTQVGWESYFHLHRQWCETIAGTEDKTEAYSFDKKGQELLKSWMQVYEKEIRQFLNIPQLGLTRYYQERAGEVLDKFNLFQGRITEFFCFLSQPMEKSLTTMQERLQELKKKGSLSDDPRDYYQMWIKTLEGDYMVLFKSTEYIEALKETLDAVMEFNLARQKFLHGFLQLSSVPTYTEIDDLSKELYQLKKQLKDLTKRKGRPLTPAHRAHP
jgi:polyhydroxyalkanoate synthase subunit PhaE